MAARAQVRAPNLMARHFGRICFVERVRKTIVFMQIATFIMNLMNAPVAEAVEVRTHNTLKLQTLANDHVELSVLRAGSVVDVPDQYRVVGKDGRTNEELTLNNWLQNAGETSYRRANNGGVFVQGSEPNEIEFFYPVKIVSAAPGSRIGTHNGATYFLALRILNRDAKNKNLTTTEDAIPVPAKNMKPAAAAVKTRSQLEAAAACTDGRCLKREQVPAPVFAQLLRDLRPALSHAQTRTRHNRLRTADDFKKIRAEFRRSCGFSLDSFLPVIRSHSERAGIPDHIMLSIMVQESSGHCFDIGQNAGSSDHGLFGLNSRSTRIRACSPAEKQWLRSAGLNNLARGPQCIENPIINLDAAIGKLREKLNTLSQPFAVRSTNTNGFDIARLRDQAGRYTTEAWRMAVSAYNGGERWVMMAKSDLENFNRKQGTFLDPLKWEDLRVFYLRRFLGQNREANYFGRVREGRTSTALLNLAYTENVVPRARARGTETKSIAELWRASDNSSQSR